MQKRKVRSIPERAKFLGQFLTKRYHNKLWCKSVYVDMIDERCVLTSVAYVVTGTTEFLEMCKKLRLRPEDPVLVELGIVSVSFPNPDCAVWQAEMAALTQAMKEMVAERQANYAFHRPVDKRRQDRKRRLQRISPSG